MFHFDYETLLGVFFCSTRGDVMLFLVLFLGVWHLYVLY